VTLLSGFALAKLARDSMPAFPFAGVGVSLIFLFESLVHGPGKESRDQVNNQDNKVDAFDLLFVDYPQGAAEGALLAEDADKVARFEYQECGEPDKTKGTKDKRNIFSRTGVHLVNPKSKSANGKWFETGFVVFRALSAQDCAGSLSSDRRNLSSSLQGFAEE
jgi:hypothetical protein